MLNGKQAHQDPDGDRDDVGCEDRSSDVETFHGAEHGDGGGKHAIAVEEGRAEEAEHHENPATAHATFRADQRHEGQDPAFTPVVGPHHESEVFHGDDDHQRPEDQRQHAEHVLRGGVYRVGPEETLANGVEGAGADVAVDDTKGGQGKDTKTPGRGNGLRESRAHWRG